MLPDYENALDFDETQYENGDLHGGSIGSIFITGGGYIRKEFKGISPDSLFGWDELVWKKSATRSMVGFAMTNIDTIEIGRVPRLEVVFNYINKDDYLALRKILNSERHFMVEYFNTDICRWVTRDMYCTKNSKDRFFTINRKFIGTINCALELVGTNNDLRAVISSDSEEETYELIKYKISYTMGSYASFGTAPITDSKTYASAYKLVPPKLVNAPSGQFFWVTKDNEGNITGKYLPNQTIVIWDNLELQAYWE